MLLEIFTHPLTLAVLALFAGLAALEALRPARPLPRVRGWRVGGFLSLLLALLVTTLSPLLWDGVLAQHTLFDLTGLGHVGGALVGLLVYELGVYAWHRTLHAVGPLFRHLHQTHHSAERLDVWGSFWFHPLDIAAFSLVTSLTLVGVAGVTVPAAIAATLFATFLNLFQHANVRTPRWLGYLVQRPESHAIHHERGVHAFNYADLPLIDLAFGTFRNPEGFAERQGFWHGASRRIGALLVGRDLSVPPAEAPVEPVARTKPLEEPARGRRVAASRRELARAS